MEVLCENWEHVHPLEIGDLYAISNLSYQLSNILYVMRIVMAIILSSCHILVPIVNH